MRSRFGAVLGLTLLASLAAAGFARAEDAQTCEVPAYLLTTDSTLSEGRGCGQERPAVERAGGGQPLVDHRFLAKPAPTRPSCRRR